MWPPCLLAFLLSILRFTHELEPPCRDLVCVELFSGVGSIMTGMYKAGHPAVGFDKSYYTDDTEDITSPRGFSRAVGLVLRIRRGGSLWAAPVCSSWGFVGRSTTGRHAWSPEGCRFNHRVLNANSMVVIVTVLFMLAYTRGVHCWLEQPTTTLMSSFTPMCEWIEFAMPHRQLVYLGAYGSATQKALYVWCTSPIVTLLERSKPLGKRTLCRNTKGKCTGKKTALSASSAYPQAFGDAVVELMVVLLR